MNAAEARDVMCSVGGWSPRCQRRSESSVVSSQHVQRRLRHLLSRVRQRRRPRHKQVNWTVCGHPSTGKPVVGRRPGSGTVRYRRQVHQ